MPGTSPYRLVVSDEIRRTAEAMRAAMQQRTKTCPHCGDHITHLRYTDRIFEFGRTDLNGGDFEAVDTDSDDSFATEYQCPNCDGAISNPEALPYDEAETASPGMPTPPSAIVEDENAVQIVDQTQTFAADIHRNASRALASMPLIVCPNCEKKTEATGDDRIVTCMHCGAEVTNKFWTGGRRNNREHHD